MGAILSAACISDTEYYNSHTLLGGTSPNRRIDAFALPFDEVAQRIVPDATHCVRGKAGCTHIPSGNIGKRAAEYAKLSILDTPKSKIVVAARCRKPKFGIDADAEGLKVDPTSATTHPMT